MIYTDENYMKNSIKRRAADSHKGNFGKVLLFAGSPGMAGAAVLCGRAALRTGSGLVQFLLPQLPCDIYPVLQTAVPEATCVPYKEDFDFNAYDAIACGCGIGQSETSRALLGAILQTYGTAAQPKKKTLLLDADALNLVSSDQNLAGLVRQSPAEIILTPHVGEAKRLLNSCAGIAGFTERKQAAIDLASTYRCIAVLKGAGTLVTDAKEICENTTGNPGMATAGSGDTLSGIIISLAGQGYAPLDAARIGVFLHGRAGDLAALELGEMSVTAGDIEAHLPFALKPFYDAAP